MPLPAIKTRYWMHSGRMHQGLPVLVGAEVLAIDFKAGVVLLRFDDPAYHDCPHVPFRTLYLSAFWAAKPGRCVMARRKLSTGDVVGAAFLAVLVWTFVAGMVFCYRHPWMTDTERFIYTWRMLTLGTVDYEEARPREHR